MTRVDEAQARYWNKIPTRAELQDVLDQYTQAVLTLQTTTVKLDLAVAFLMDHLHIDNEQVKVFMERKVAEMKAAQEKAAS